MYYHLFQTTHILIFLLLHSRKCLEIGQTIITYGTQRVKNALKKHDRLFYILNVLLFVPGFL